MPDKPSLTIVKSFNYRGAREEFSNTYHFDGTTPVDRAAWITLATAVINAEKLTVRSTVHFDRAYGYEAGNAMSVAQIDYNDGVLTRIDGTYAGTGGSPSPGDAAAWIRWPTSTFVNGKRVYLRKYMHGIEWDTAVGADTIAPAHKAVLLTYGGKWIDGTLPGSAKICGPQGALGGTPQVSQFLTTRTLKRRGKRNPS